MTIEEYNKLVNPDVVAVVDYGRWINFQESYPPLPEKKHDDTLFEILYHNGEPEFNYVYHDGKNVRLRRYDLSMDLLEYFDPEVTDCYWRFIPDPPGNDGYSCY